jgi:hypothetical protein
VSVLVIDAGGGHVITTPEAVVGEPRRGYSWAPFEPGNTVATVHGAHSDRKLRPIVDELLEGLADAAPWTSAPVFAPTREAWAWAEAQCVLYRQHFDTTAIVGGDAEPVGLATWDRVERRAAAKRTELGLSPASLARLLSSLSAIDGPAAKEGLEALKATGAALVAAATALPPAPDSGGITGGAE